MDNIDCEKANSDRIKHFQQLLSPIHIGLYKYIFCIIKNKVSAEDVYQNTLLIAYTHLHQLRDEIKFKSWIFRIAKNEALHYINTNSKTNLEICIDLLENNMLRDYNSEKSNPEQIAVSNELKSALIRAVNSLNQDDRDLVILYYYSELSLKEIANLFNANINKIKTRHRTIKKKIYEELYAEGLVSELKTKKSLLSLGGTKNVQR